jgi:hypothetical protein
MAIHWMLGEARVTDQPRTSSLEVGQHIFRHDRLSISLGSSWCWGLYHDWHNRSWYVTEKGYVFAIFRDEEYAAAAKLYGEKSER